MLTQLKRILGIWGGGGTKSSSTSGWVPVRPKNYRSIALRAIAEAADPVVLVNHRRILDFTEAGPLTQRQIRGMRDLEIRDGSVPILGFHDHPDEMWVSKSFESLAIECQKEGWLSIERTVA